MVTSNDKKKSGLDAVIETIHKRRAVRSYKHQPVAGALVEQILEAGRMAPSAMNRQPWRFYVVNNTKLIKTLSEEIARVVERHYPLIHYIDNKVGEDPIFHAAPVVIFITIPRDNEWAPVDAGMCAENMMLAAEGLGLNTCPVGLARFVEKTPAYSCLGTGPSERVCLAIIVGHGSEQPEIKERKRDNVVYVN